MVSVPFLTAEFKSLLRGGRRGHPPQLCPAPGSVLGCQSPSRFHINDSYAFGPQDTFIIYFKIYLFIKYLFIYLFILVALGLSCGTRDLLCDMHVESSSPTRDRTRAPCIGSVESYPLDHQGSTLRTLLNT